MPLGQLMLRTSLLHYTSLMSSVANPFHFDTDPDLQIRFVETRIRPKLEKVLPFFRIFFLITQKMIYYYINIENINSNEK